MTKIQPKTVWPALPGRKKTITPGTSFNFCNMESSFHNNITYRMAKSNSERSD